MMLDVDITSLHTQLAQCQQQLLVSLLFVYASYTHTHTQKHSVLVDNAKKIQSTAFLFISLCPYESTHMREKKNEKSTMVVTTAS
jgi:hypothetical protein